MLALDDEKPIGLLAGFIVDNGSTVVWRRGRVMPGRRGQGVFRGLREALDDFLGEHFPSVCREEVSVNTTQIPNSEDNPWRRILEYDALHYAVDEKTSSFCSPILNIFVSYLLPLLNVSLFQFILIVINFPG